MFRHHKHEHLERRYGRDPFEFHRRGFGGRHEHFGWRHGRIFDTGDLRFIILRLVADKPRHGYEIIKDIEEQLGGSYSPSPGVVYPTLTLLEELGYVAVTPIGAKKQYSITAEGAAFLADNRTSAEAAAARLAKASHLYGHGPAPEILRAIQNLRLTLRLRLGKGSMSSEQVSAITAILDRAAFEIERS